MTFKPTIWYPISVVLSAINVAAVGFAAEAAEPYHATAHVGLALAFAWWAQRLRRARGESRPESDLEPRLEVLEADMSRVQQELSEAQEQLDFMERLLAQEAEARRVGPQR
jgi:hypothetical protein